VTAGAAAEKAGTERTGHGVLAEAEPEQPDVGHIAGPVRVSPARPHPRAGMQVPGRGDVHSRAAERRDVGDGQVGRGQAAHDRSVAVAQQRDLATAGGEAGDERPQRPRTLLGVGRPHDGRADGARGGVAEPGDDREVGAGIKPACLRREGSGSAAGRGRATGIERGQGGVRAGHQNGHPCSPGQVADDLDRLTRATGVEAEEMPAAHGFQRPGEIRVARPARRACGRRDRGRVGGVAGQQCPVGEGGQRLHRVTRAARQYRGCGREHGGCRGGGDGGDRGGAAESHGSVLPVQRGAG
jgi:hypothetical protein